MKHRSDHQNVGPVHTSEAAPHSAHEHTAGLGYRCGTNTRTVADSEHSAVMANLPERTHLANCTTTVSPRSPAVARVARRRQLFEGLKSSTTHPWKDDARTMPEVDTRRDGCEETDVIANFFASCNDRTPLHHAASDDQTVQHSLANRVSSDASPIFTSVRR